MRNILKTRRLVAAGAVALLAAALAPGAFAAAKLRVLHAAPDIPAVTVYVNGQEAVGRLGTLRRTGYLSVPAGTYRLAVSLAGRPASEAALRATVRLRDGKRYTALARGLLARGTAELALQRDIRAARPRMAALRVWHLSPDAPNVDVFVNGRRVLANVPYEAASGYVMVPGGRYAVRVNAAGTTTSVFAGRLTLRAGRAYTAAALGAVEAEGRPFRVKLFTDAIAPRRAHAAAALAGGTTG